MKYFLFFRKTSSFLVHRKSSQCSQNSYLRPNSYEMNSHTYVYDANKSFQGYTVSYTFL